MARNRTPGQVSEQAMRRATWLSVVALGTCALLAAAEGLALAAPRCATVEIVDRAGRPIAGAEVSHFRTDPRRSRRRGWSPEIFTTNAAGRVCAEDFRQPGFLELHAPARLGGWCAADE